MNQNKKLYTTKKRGRPKKADAQAAMALWIEAADMAKDLAMEDLFELHAPPKGANSLTFAICAMNLKEAINARRNPKTRN